MIKSNPKLLAFAFVGVLILAGGFAAVIFPYFFLPSADRLFLESKPTLTELNRRFGEPAEVIPEGGYFPMTGWRPLPEKRAAHAGVSFVRKYGSKIYVFLDEENRAVQFIFADS